MEREKYIWALLFRLKNIKIGVHCHFCYLYLTKISGNLILLHEQKD
ncbi:hypothetical protein HMPREF1991_02502 [Hoylesella loescheii DSM 19665 = JCM 12249 = ATCC 15930]|uniref:Uncharacterized protein n=1 Tax=Hoylesella loescheii DSM 19665 = JCM 12249 = ATCC 15930 TaxID=1122985 RepID=A0A069QEV1_HOYLO|nr:hypothetical protein HMPREF1991_02502 [Hoylesella loescheii DSM 19665 = JCM 12249 = ATCC 15930]